MEIGPCDYFASKGVYICNTKVIGKFVRERLRIAYENVNDEGRYHIAGQSIFDVLCDTEANFPDQLLAKGKERDLFDDLMKNGRPDRHDITEGDRDYYEGGDARIVLKGFMDGAELFQHQSLNKTLATDSVIWRARPINSNFEHPKNPLDILNLDPAIHALGVPFKFFINSEENLPEFGCAYKCANLLHPYLPDSG